MRGYISANQTDGDCSPIEYLQNLKETIVEKQPFTKIFSVHNKALNRIKKIHFCWLNNRNYRIFSGHRVVTEIFAKNNIPKQKIWDNSSILGMRIWPFSHYFCCVHIRMNIVDIVVSFFLVWKNILSFFCWFYTYFQIGNIFSFLHHRRS